MLLALKRTRRVAIEHAALKIGKSRQPLLTLAIETSCDDTSVAVLETRDETSVDAEKGDAPSAILHFHEKVTSNNLEYRGVHPLIALISHQQNLGKLLAKAVSALPEQAVDEKTSQNGPINRIGGRCLPDFISVTRGPGMMSNLNTGLDTAKGLAVAWHVPLVGVNHMQAHALTPRLVTAMAQKGGAAPAPSFPFLSLLVSGGHTMLIHSKSLTDHPTLASTCDVALGDAIDKIARHVLPEETLASATSTMYGPLLESFAFPNGQSDYNYSPPTTWAEERKRRITSWGWGFVPPLSQVRSGAKSKSMEYSFTGMVSCAKRFVEDATHELSLDERRDLAREAMRVAFEHLASRVVMGLENGASIDPDEAATIDTIVVSGGVAANKYLRCM